MNGERLSAPGFLFGVVACLPACVFEPTNETDLGSVREEVTFRGVAIVPRARITIVASPRAGGGYVQIASTFSDAAPFQWDGATLYEFEVSAPIPANRWMQNCNGWETFVRVRGGSLNLTTYDSDNLGTEAPEDCITGLVDAGTPFVLAARQCSSPASPNVRLTAPGQASVGMSVAGNLQITSHRHAGDWQCLEAVDGSLFVTDPYPEDIAFPLLASVTGNLLLTYGHAGGLVARTIDAPVLESVGGDVNLLATTTNNGVPNIDVDFGLPALATIGGDLNIESGELGTTQADYAGLNDLTSLPGNLNITANFGDNSWGSFAPNLAFVGGNVAADLGFSVSGGLDAVATIDGDLTVELNSWLGGNGGFDGLEAVGGDFFSSGAFFYADDYPLLESVGGDLELEFFSMAGPAGSYFPVIGAVGGVLVFRNMDNGISNFGSDSVSVGGITLESNSNLGDLASTLSGILLNPNGPATFVDNDGISDCDAEDWLDGVPGYAGVATISGNDPC